MHNTDPMRSALPTPSPRIRRHGVVSILGRVPAILALLFLSTTWIRAQNSLFLFDADGSLLLETNESEGSPLILGQPQLQVVQPGEAAFFSVAVADTRGLTYQWQFSGTNVPGATGDALQISNVTTNNQGTYWVVLANGYGTVTSAPAALWIDSRGCGMPDSWQLQYFGNLNNNATADYDHDGVSNLQEFLDGTNPTNAASRLFRLTVLSDGGSVQTVPDQPGYTNGQLVTLTATPWGAQPFNIWTGDVISKSNTITLTMTNNRTEFAHFLGATFSWASQSGGDWNVASNWNLGLVPGPFDYVVITSTVPVTIGIPTQCGALLLGSPSSLPTISCSNTLTLLGNGSVWVSGILNGGGRLLIASNSSLTITNMEGTLSLSSFTLENAGAVTWEGSSVLPPTLSSAFITNDPGATFVCLNALTLNSAAPNLCQFDNAGTFWIASGGALANYIPFNNTGLMQVQAGTFTCHGAFTNTGTVNFSSGATNFFYGGFATGSFSASAPSLVEFDPINAYTASVFILNPGAQLTGDGLYRINGADLIANANLAVSNLDMLTGTLDGTGVVTVGGAMNWTFGTMQGTGRTIIGPAAVLNVNSAAGVALTTRTLENAGTTTWTNGGPIQLTGAVITNDAGAVFDIQNAASVTDVGTNACRVDNAGTLRKLYNSGTTTVASLVSLNNYGELLVETGTLLWNGPFNNTGTTAVSSGATNWCNGGGFSSGAFSAAAPSLLQWTYGTFILNSGAQLNGNGQYRINGATFIDNADLAVSNLDLLSGTLDGSGALTLNTAMNWNSGTMQGSGRTIIGPAASLQIANPAVVIYLNTRTLENAGTTTWTGTYGMEMTGSVITNRAGGLFDCQAAFTINNFATNTCRVDNSGTLRKSTNTGTLTFSAGTYNVPVVLNNYGSLLIQSGTLLCSGPITNTGSVMLSAGTTLQMPGGGSASGSFTTTAPSLADWTGGTFTLTPGAQLLGNGVYRVDAGSGTLIDNADVSVSNLDVFTGTFDGTGIVTVNSAMNWEGGTMQGTGRTIIGPAAILQITNSFVTPLVTRTLENAGTVVWSGSAYLQLSGSVFTNRPGALFDLQNAGTVSYSANPGRIDNAGTLRKSVNAGLTTIISPIPLNNYGALNVQAGTLLCSGPVTNIGTITLSAGTTNRFTDGGGGSGTFSATAPSLVEWTVGTFTLNSGSLLNGNGLYRINGATLTDNTDLSVSNLDILGGTLSGSNTLTLLGAMNWNGGTMQGSGRTIFAPGTIVNIANPGGLTLTTRTLENAGTVTWTGAQIQMNSAVITNRAGALFDVQTGASVGFGSGTCRFDNAGTFQKSVSTNLTQFGSVPLNNYNTVALRSGILNPLAGYNSTINSLLNCTLAGPNAGPGYGQLQVAGTVNLAGSLSLSLTNGYLPATNTSFTLVSVGTRAGAFSSFSYPSNKVTMLLSNTASSVLALVTGVAPPPPPPIYLSLSLAGSNAVLFWNAVSNTTYRLQFNPELNTSNWNDLPGDVLAVTNSATKLDLLIPSNRFYRVRILP